MFACVKCADIEELGGEFGPALLCPWHHYHISLEGGKRVYRDLQHKLCALGQKQRTHYVKEDVEGNILVKLDLAQVPVYISADKPLG